jgi:pimeloyl-ACP methyl ester carboxylesterase
MKTRQEADAALAKKIPDLALRQFLLKNLDRTESGAFQWRIALNEIHQGYSEMIKAVAWDSQPFLQPTLFIRGAHSDYIKDSDIPTIKALFPHARMAAIPNAGHWVHAEAPQEFARTVLDFLIKDDAMTD